jgi:hypothetical protein
LNAGWDERLLGIELADLRDLGADLNLIGFSNDELAGIFAKADVGLTDPDEVPEPPVEPVSTAGDVWLLGRHRLACGDCTDRGTVDAALGGVQPHLMVTDPLTAWNTIRVGAYREASAREPTRWGGC